MRFLSWCAARCICGAFAVHSRCICGAFAVHLRCICGAFAVHSRNLLHFIRSLRLNVKSGKSQDGLDLRSSRVSQVAVHSTHEVSDHDLVTWSLATRTLPPRKIITYYHRNLKNIGTDLFQEDTRKSVLFTDPADSVDGFADQLESTLGGILERHCPLRKRT